MEAYALLWFVTFLWSFLMQKIVFHGTDFFEDSKPVVL